MYEARLLYHHTKTSSDLYKPETKIANRKVNSTYMYFSILFNAAKSINMLKRFKIRVGFSAFLECVFVELTV